MSPTLQKGAKKAGAKKAGAKTAAKTPTNPRLVAKSGGKVGYSGEISRQDMEKLWKQFPVLDACCTGKYTITLTGTR